MSSGSSGGGSDMRSGFPLPSRLLRAPGRGSPRCTYQPVGPRRSVIASPVPGVGAECPRAGIAVLFRGGGAQAPAVAAVRVFRAADEGAVAAELQLETVLPAGRAAPTLRIPPGPSIPVAAEQEGVEARLDRRAHRPAGQLAGHTERRVERLPEVFQHGLAGECAGGDPVEVVLHRGSEAVIHPAP